MLLQPDAFVSHISQDYCLDIAQNLQWYLQNYTSHPEILLNINYPSRTEKEFLKQLELW